MASALEDATGTDAPAAKGTAGARPPPPCGGTAAKVAGALFVLLAVAAATAAWAAPAAAARAAPARAPEAEEGAPAEAVAPRPTFLGEIAQKRAVEAAVEDAVAEEEGVFDCKEESAMWRQAWSDEKKRYCCLHEVVGCQLEAFNFPGSLAVMGGVLAVVVCGCCAWVIVRQLRRQRQERPSDWYKINAGDGGRYCCTGCSCAGY